MSKISKLEHMDHGCSIDETLFGSVMHADDVGLLVLSASVNGLQLMINASSKSRVKYLGVVFLSGPSLCVDCNVIKRKLYAASYSIFYSC